MQKTTETSEKNKAIGECMPLVSVIVPVYNRLELAGKAIDSALAQTYKNLEIIVVDDGSTDHSGIKLKSRYPEISLITKKNGGVSRARNDGARAAKGEILAFLDSDDSWAPNKIERQLIQLTNSPGFSYCLTGVCYYSATGAKLLSEDRSKQLEGGVISSYKVALDPSLIPSSLIIYKNTFASLCGFDERLKTAEDIDFYLRLARMANGCVVDEPLTFIIQPDTLPYSLSSSDSVDEDQIRAVQAFVEAAREMNFLQKQNIIFELKLRLARSKAYRNNFSGAALDIISAASKVTSLSALTRLALVAAKVVYRMLMLSKRGVRKTTTK